jgi:hypothetical protein
MSYNISSIPIFDRQASDWQKNTLHLKKTWPGLSKNSPMHLNRERLLATTFIKSVWPLLQKEKENQGALGSLHT